MGWGQNSSPLTSRISSASWRNYCAPNDPEWVSGWGSTTKRTEGAYSAPQPLNWWRWGSLPLPKTHPDFALCLSALRVSGCSIGGGWLLFVGGSTPPVCTVVIMLNTTSYLVVVVYCQRVLTERREAVFKTVVQWSNSVVVMTVVRIQAAPLLWLVVVSAVLVTVTPWIVQQRWTGLVRRHRN